ncbi:MAG: flagellar hook-associated protein FlgL [Nitrospirae bacterium]|nr:flagellar hook-associated protein FlgL [Candidatus Troglogloeales bacterium]
MRVSEKMLFDSNTRGLRLNASALLKAQDRVSSGKKVLSPSDDPISATRILNFNKTIAQVDQHLKNMDESERFLSASESVLSGVAGRIDRASELAVGMTNPSNNPEDRKIAAAEVKQIFEELTAMANTVHNGQHIFAGNKTATPPFDFEKKWQGQYVGTTLKSDLFPITIDSSNDSLNVTVDGINIQVTLTPSDDYSREGLAEEIETKINAHPDLAAKSASVSVAFVPDDPEENPDTSPGHFVITSNMTGGRSSVTPNLAVGIRIGLGLNDELTIPIGENSVTVTLADGLYRDGAELAKELKTKLKEVGETAEVQFDTDHFLITPLGGSPFVLASPVSLAFGDARSVLGLLSGKSQLSGENQSLDEQYFQGDAGEISVLVEPGVRLAKNIPGSRVFNGGANGVDIFSSLLNLQTALETSNIVGIQTAVADMEKATEQVSSERATIGLRLNRLDTTKVRLEDFKFLTTESKSKEEDIDLAEAISELAQQQNALAASQSVLARILQQPTLLSFLR